VLKISTLYIANVMSRCALPNITIQHYLPARDPHRSI
jgi:hypothetical protein